MFTLPCIHIKGSHCIVNTNTTLSEALLPYLDLDDVPGVSHPLVACLVVVPHPSLHVVVEQVFNLTNIFREFWMKTSLEVKQIKSNIERRGW